MSNIKPLSELAGKRFAVADLVASLRSDNESHSAEAGRKLIRSAAEFGLSVRDYLTLAVEPTEGLNGYETTLVALNLPFKNSFEDGVVLQAASETFQTYPGTRAMFPEVIDDMLRWAFRQDQFESAQPMIANSRTINGPELLSTVVNDDSAELDTSTIAEGARIPVRSIRTSQSSVSIWKHGSSIRTTYEFNRRASLDILTPYANRIARELERSKATAAYNVLLNGDGVNAAANVLDQSDHDTITGTTSVAGTINWECFLYWLIDRAKVGTPVDTVVGNWDSAYKWARLWATNGSETKPDAGNMETVMAKMNANGLPLQIPTFAVSSAASANHILGFTKGETLEELVEAGSQIQESDRAIANQTILYTKTENTGYKLAYGDTREVFNYGA